MVGFTCLAVQVLMWQSQDISVDIVSENQTGNQEVTISIRNTAGSTLLFYENAEITGKIEYLSENGWVEYCDVSYTAGNAKAISQLYGGTFAELEPGEGWNLSVPEDKVADMKNGTYRIKMTYITEKNYNKYMNMSYKNSTDINKNNSGKNNSQESGKTKPDTSSGTIPNGGSNDITVDIYDDVSGNKKPNNASNDLISNTNKNESSETIVSDEVSEEEEEEYLAASKSEVFIKVFNYEAPEDFVSEISIEGRSIDTDNNSKATRARKQTSELE